MYVTITDVSEGETRALANEIERAIKLVVREQSIPGLVWWWDTQPPPNRAREIENSSQREVNRLRSAIWAYFTLGPERRSQAESILRSALPDDYKPVGG